MNGAREILVLFFCIDLVCEGGIMSYADGIGWKPRGMTKKKVLRKEFFMVFFPKSNGEQC